jgi:hypothetical protein
MRSLLLSAWAVALYPLLSHAGNFRSHIDSRNARYETFAEPKPSRRSLEERSESFKFMSNSTRGTRVATMLQ